MRANTPSSVTTGAGVGFLDLVRMTFRKVNPTVITRSKIMAVQAGLYDSEGITIPFPMRTLVMRDPVRIEPPAPTTRHQGISPSQLRRTVPTARAAPGNPA